MATTSANAVASLLAQAATTLKTIGPMIGNSHRRARKAAAGPISIRAVGDAPRRPPEAAFSPLRITLHGTDYEPVRPASRFSAQSINLWVRGAGMRVLAVTALVPVAILMGCATARQENTAQLDAADNERCLSYKTTPGTPAYTDCRLKLERQRALLAQDRPPPPPPNFKNCPTEASGLYCVGPTQGR